MVSAIVNIIIGLFIWMVLPRLIYNKRKCPKYSPHFFVNLSCKIVGIAVIAFAILSYIENLLDFDN